MNVVMSERLTASAEYADTLLKRGFRLGECVGSGAYGTVYRAEQQSLRRSVAIKFFDNKFMVGDANRTRFEREAPLLARVQHPSIPYVITNGAVSLRDGLSIPYVVMQFVSGPSLLDRLSSKEAMGMPLVLKVMRDLLSALDCAHQNEVVHRDVKPDNILMSEHTTFLIDFSIGFAMRHNPGLVRATALGERVGTADYAAPEQLRDSSTVDARADIYSAGVVLAEMLGARVRLRVDTLDVELSRIPGRVRDVIKKSVAEKPENRFATANEFWGALDACRDLGVSVKDGDTSRVLQSDGLLTDDDAMLMGLVASACTVPNDSIDVSYLEQQLKGVMSRFVMNIAIRRLGRFGLIEYYVRTDWNSNEAPATRMTEAGAEWAELHRQRVAPLMDMLQRKTSGRAPGLDDDIPF